MSSRIFFALGPTRLATPGFSFLSLLISRSPVYLRLCVIIRWTKTKSILGSLTRCSDCCFTSFGFGMGDAVRSSTELQRGIRGAEGLGSVELIGLRRESEESALVGDGGVGGFVEDRAVEVVKKKRRGRPPRAQGKVQPTVKENDEEDVCFICFDGGSLVLCDRRGCPKAYHPACIKRDEAFFQSAARWNCGWHICSICQKSSHFMCYTCTFSLCKGCTKGAGFMCVRGNKGFCNICLNMVKLVENMEPGNKETVQVDFDDKTSWEYLFKVYWIYLKTKLCLTSDELAKAKRVDISVSLSRKGRKGDLCANDVSCLYLDFLDEGQAMPNGKRRKTGRWSAALHKGASKNQEKVGARFFPSITNPPQKASKDLLEFVSPMKKDDTSFLTSFDAQSLLLHYIKINDLHDPNCQSQIICDSKLRNLFGKSRLGHSEMLKLLEYHFQPQEDSPAESVAPMRGYDPNGLKLDSYVGATDKQLLGKDIRIREGNKGAETICDVYAAVDMHNINLIYLPLHLLEKFLADDKFHEKAVGSVVRIKMSSSDQKQDIYRLVQVVGTVKVDDPYKVRNKLTSWKLEILNISKKEVISINEISDQEFSEDECKRFRQSIKYGLATRLKVREILEKAMALRTIKAANYLEREILRLSHLRDRASEKGQNKEFKEYVDKIELLNSPEERQRLHNEVPEVHEELNVDPRHRSEEDSRLPFHTKDGDIKVANNCGTKRNGGNSMYLSGIDNDLNRLNCGANEATELSTSYNENKKALTSMISEKQSSYVEGITDRPTDSNAWKQIGNSLIQSKSASAINQFVVENEMHHRAVRDTSVEKPSAGDFETEKIWHYRDPSWNIQGPFSILQLRKWNTSGYFPLDIRIWRTGEKQDESILLTDALDGQLCKKSQVIYNTCEISIQSNVSSDFVRSSCSSSTPAEIAVNSRDGQCADSMRSHESLSSYSQLSSSPSTQILAGKACEALSLLGQERWDGPRCNEKGSSEGVRIHHSRLVPHINSEDLGSQTAEKKEVNLGQTSYADTAADEKQLVALNISSVDSCRSSITDSVLSSHQLNPTFNSCGISMEILPTCSTQSAPYVLTVELEPGPVNPCHLANGEVVNQTVVGSDAPLSDEVSSWIDGSCLANASGEPPMMANAWRSNSIVGSLPKQDELPVEVTETQPTTDGQNGVASTLQFWHSIFGEEDKFPFADESVSDLLAEVDAMECLNGPASPTSAMVQAAQYSQTAKED